MTTALAITKSSQQLRQTAYVRASVVHMNKWEGHWGDKKNVVCTHSKAPAVLPEPSMVFDPHRCSCSVTLLIKSGSVSQSSSTASFGTTFLSKPTLAFHMTHYKKIYFINKINKTTCQQTSSRRPVTPLSTATAKFILNISTRKPN